MSHPIVPHSQATSTALPAPVRIFDPAPPAVVRVDPYGALLADASNPRTHRARVQDIADLGKFLGMADPSEAAALVCSGTAVQANAVALGYRRHLLDRALAPATINRRLSTLRRLAKLARRLGLVDWTPELDSLKAEAYRDTAGPGHDGWRKLLAAAEAGAAGGSPKGLRDLALLRLLHDNALRRGEVVGIDVGDVDLDGSRVAVVGKGKGERRWLAINAATARALAAWLAARMGPPSGPAFIRLDAAGGGRPGRLTGDGVHEIVRALGRKAALGRAVRPHGLRHAAVTRALELSGGDIRAVQRFSRHARADTVLVYDDNREDLGGTMTRRLGEDA